MLVGTLRHELSQPSIWVRHRISFLSCKVSAYVGLRQDSLKEVMEEVLKNNQKKEWTGTNRHTAGDLHHGPTCRVSDELAFCSRNDRTPTAHRRHPLSSLHPLWLRPRIDSPGCPPPKFVQASSLELDSFDETHGYSFHRPPSSHPGVITVLPPRSNSAKLCLSAELCQGSLSTYVIRHLGQSEG